MTFLVTSADSGILVMNTIMSGGEQETDHKHRIIWGVVLTLVIGTLLLDGGGGMGALKNAMIIAALPFTFVMVLMIFLWSKRCTAIAFVTKAPKRPLLNKQANIL
jgi:choline/glycine/proline betaine transport protein